MNRAIALAHATQVLGSPECAENFIFRNGACNICGGDCFCASDDELVERLLTGLKPVGSFPFMKESEAKKYAAGLAARGLTTFIGKNKWEVWVVLAALHPGRDVGGIGTPRNVAFTQEFLDEGYTLEIIGKLYGYRRPNDLSQLDRRLSGGLGGRLAHTFPAYRASRPCLNTPSTATWLRYPSSSTTRESPSAV